MNRDPLTHRTPAIIDMTITIGMERTVRITGIIGSAMASK